MYAVTVVMALLVGLILFVFLSSKGIYDDIEDIKDGIDELNDKLDKIIRKLNKIAEK